jgi:hypothetical protein
MFSRVRCQETISQFMPYLNLLRGQVLLAISLSSEISDDY